MEPLMLALGTAAGLFMSKLIPRRKGPTVEEMLSEMYHVLYQIQHRVSTARDLQAAGLGLQLVAANLTLRTTGTGEVSMVVGPLATRESTQEVTFKLTPPKAGPTAAESPEEHLPQWSARLVDAVINTLEAVRGAAPQAAEHGLEFDESFTVEQTFLVKRGFGENLALDTRVSPVAAGFSRSSFQEIALDFKVTGT